MPSVAVGKPWYLSNKTLVLIEWYLSNKTLVLVEYEATKKGIEG